MNTYVLALLVVFVAYANAKISCYQCISSVDEGCDSSETDALEKYKKPCEELKTGTFKKTGPIGCRKIVQVEEDPITIIRECAYTGGPIDGQKKSGNYAVSKTYYQCENQSESEPCNGGSSLGLLSAVALLVAFFQ